MDNTHFNTFLHIYKFTKIKLNIMIITDIKEDKIYLFKYENNEFIKIKNEK